MKFDIDNCTLCPRACHANRTKQAGICGGRDTIRCARAMLHYWEEPCISGSNGSGAIFFSGCALHCRFCQNAVISAEPYGKYLTPERLAEIMLNLQNQGAHNINLVTACHFVPWVIDALGIAKKSLHIPIVWNTGGYETVETLQALEGYVDIYLPDFKFFSPETAKHYANAENYPETAKKALSEMLRQTGKPVFDGMLLKKGCIVRHLVLPKHRHESIALLQYLAETYGTDQFLLSLMSQYTPMQQDEQFPELNRRITKMEYYSVLDKAQELGFDGYLQDSSSAKEEYTPDFHLQGL